MSGSQLTPSFQNGVAGFSFWYSVPGAEAKGYILSEVGLAKGFIGNGQQGGNGLQAGIFGDKLGVAEMHFNGSVGLIGFVAKGYNKMSNDIKRSYAYKLSKKTGWKSGKIFQQAKAFSKGTSKITGKLGPYGIALTASVTLYEATHDTWDAHTIVNGSLLFVGVAATIFCAPAVITGIALYGIGDYFFDFSGKIDSTVGRKSGIW